MENPDWLIKVRVYRTSQVVYSSTIIYLTKLYKRLLAILLFIVIALQKGSKVARQPGVGLAGGGSSKS